MLTGFCLKPQSTLHIGLLHRDFVWASTPPSIPHCVDSGSLAGFCLTLLEIQICTPSISQYYLGKQCPVRYSVNPIIQFSSVQLLSHVPLFATLWTAAHQVSLSITSSWNLLKLKPIESVMPSNHFILCCPLLFLPSIFPSIRVLSSESVLHIRWPKYWSFSLSPYNEYSGLISFRID